MLCERCEGKIKHWEDYAIAFKSRKAGCTIAPADRGTIKVSGIDYVQMKLFCMSVLWRASVCTLPAFSLVSLGDCEETVRDMLHRSDPGDPLRFCTAMDAIRHRYAPMAHFICNPSSGHVHGLRCFHFVFGGFVWIMFGSANGFPVGDSHRVLSKEGSITMGMVDAVKVDGIRAILEEARKMGRLPTEVAQVLGV